MSRRKTWLSLLIFKRLLPKKRCIMAFLLLAIMYLILCADHLLAFQFFGLSLFYWHRHTLQSPSSCSPTVRLFLCCWTDQKGWQVGSPQRVYWTLCFLSIDYIQHSIRFLSIRFHPLSSSTTVHFSLLFLFYRLWLYLLYGWSSTHQSPLWTGYVSSFYWLFS